MDNFGTLLRQHRLNTVDPVKKGIKPLTQGRFAGILAADLNYPPSKYISYWENNDAQYVIRHTERPLLVGIVKTLVGFDGMNSLYDANRLLWSGGYRPLDIEEATLVDETWASVYEKELSVTALLFKSK